MVDSFCDREETNGDFIYSYRGPFCNHCSSHYSIGILSTPYVK